MKTTVWILTLAGTVPVLLLAALLLVMHAAANIIGSRDGHSDFIVSLARGESSYIMSTRIWPLFAILAGGGLLLFGVWKLLQH